MSYTNKPWGFFSAADFVAHPWPEREVLMAPWLMMYSISVIYAKPGVGKSNFVLGLAMAMAKGEAFLGFSPSRPLRVVYVDGEMPPQELKKRLMAMANGTPQPDNLHIYNTSSTEAHYRIASLNTEDGQSNLINRVDSVAPDVLILDNKSTLMSNARENEAGSWDDCQRWLMTLRASGLAIILLHHAGKNGQQRGTSALEVTPEIIIELYEPDGPPPETGSHFVVDYEKKRHLTPAQAKPMLVHLEMGEESAAWSWKPYKGERKATDPRRQQARDLYAQGVGQREIARQLGASPSSVNGWVTGVETGVRRSAALGETNAEHLVAA